MGPPIGPCYHLFLSAGDGARYAEDLGWGPEMRVRLWALRKILEGDAARAMDKLLKQLAEQEAMERLRPKFTPRERLERAEKAFGERRWDDCLGEAAAVTLWQWGGYPSKVDPDNKRPALVRVRGLTGVAAVAAGRHYLALKTDGTVWATNGRSAASIRPRDPSLPGVGVKGLVPGLVEGLKDVTAVATTCDHSLALQADGTVRAWGWNHFGQLGDGTTRTWYPPSAPVRVRGLGEVTAIAAGSSHSLALRKDGTVWAWGRNVDGELGDGTNIDRHLPVEVRGLDRVTAIAAGGERSLALRADGTVWAWGNNFLGQVGDGTRTFRNSPVRVVGLEKIAAISAGRAHSLALGKDGTVWVWGGHGSRNTEVGVPAPVSELTGAVAIAGGDLHSLVLRPDGTVWAWGGNMYGELGGSPDKWHDVPAQVKGLTGVTAIAAGDHYSLALRAQDAKGETTDAATGGEAAAAE